MGIGSIAKKIVTKACWTLFPFMERLGVHVMPVHYYSPIPDTRWLSEHAHLFDVPYPMDGVVMDDAAQLRIVEEVVAPYQEEFMAAGGSRFGVRSELMRSYAPINALTLYAFVRHYRPRRIIEVGSGMSTIIAAEAARANRESGGACEYTVIEPFPREELRRGVGGVTCIVEKVEDVSPDVFGSLGKDDILFIDSSHTVKVFGDVNHLYLRVLPLIRKGVIIHVHDIFFPFDYRPHHFAVKAKQIWQEQYLLHAFLIFNSEFEVLLSNSFVHHRSLARLRELFPWYDEKRWPSSFWMRRRP